MPDRAPEPEHDLVRADRGSRRREVGRVLGDDDRVPVHGQAEVAARRPELVERRVVERAAVAGDQHAGETVVARPAHLGDRLVEVVEEHLREPGAPSRQLCAEVGQPPVVRLDALPTQAVLLLRLAAPSAVMIPEG